jgi:DNA-binding CsgD family transcriptional regulator
MLLKQRTLSPRQREALWYTAHGLTARQIGEKMTCSEQTVKNFLYYARMKYQASNNAHLVFIVLCPPDITSA